MKVLLMFLTVTIFNLSCISKKMPRYYKDIDLFHLKGLTEVSPSELQYPYLQIDSINKQEIKITWKADSSYINIERYTKNKNIWQSINIEDSEVEGRKFKTYKYIKRDSIIEVHYETEVLGGVDLFERFFDTYYLTKVDVIYGNTKLSYIFPSIKLKPTADLNSYPLDQIIRKHHTLLEKNGNNLIIKEKAWTAKGELEFESRDCFTTILPSINWIIGIGHVGTHSVSCK